MFFTASPTKNTGGLTNLGQQGHTGYHAYGSAALSTDFISIKKSDEKKIGKIYGKQMASQIVNGHNLPTIRIPEFGEVLARFSRGEDIEAPSEIYGEFSDAMRTPSLSAAVLANTRAGGTGVPTTPGSFGSHITDQTDDALLRSSHLAKYSQIVEQYKTHNARIIADSSVISAELVDRCSLHVQSILRMTENRRHPDYAAGLTAVPIRKHFLIDSTNAGVLYGAI